MLAVNIASCLSRAGGRVRERTHAVPPIESKQLTDAVASTTSSTRPGAWRLGPTDFRYLRQPAVPLLCILAGAMMLLVAPRSDAQSVVDIVESPADTYWSDMMLYQAGGKLFIADNTAGRLLVYDTQSLVLLDEISLVSYLPDAPQPSGLAVHEATGTLYVVVDQGWATSRSSIVVIDADTHAITTTLADAGYDLMLTIDEARARLYYFGGDDLLQDTLTAVDVATNSVVGSLDIQNLMGSGIIDFNRDGGLNPVTGELVFTNRHNDRFVIANGQTLTGEAIDAVNSRGWTGIWNTTENKVFITEIGWSGYFSYDRDTATPGFAACPNDGTDLFFNSASNRVYSGSEIDGYSAVINGATDDCQEVEVSGLVVGFATTRQRLYYVDPSSVEILDENTLNRVAWFRIPGPGGGGIVGSQVLVDATAQRVFGRSYRDLTEGELSCVIAIDDLAPIITDHPRNQAVFPGGTATLTVAATGSSALHYQWFQGARRETSVPVGTDSPSYTTPGLTQATSYWVRVGDAAGQADSNTAVVGIDSAPGSWATQDSGTSWALYDVVFVNDSTGWAVGDWGTVLKTDDGGASWSKQSSGTTNRLFGVHFTDAQRGWAVGGGGLDSTILATDDGGATWTSQSSGMTNRLYGVYFVDPQTGWVVGEQGTILKTTNGGGLWTAQYPGNWDWFYDVVFANTEIGWAVGYGGTVLKTSNGGTSWDAQTIATVNSVNGVAFSDSGTGWLASGDINFGYRGKVFATTDGGASWTGQDDTGTWEHCLNAVDFTDASVGWMVGTGGLIVKTVDGGTTWYTQSSGTTAELHGVHLTDQNTGWAVGASGVILRYTYDPKPIFADGFESGDTSLWSASIP